MWIRILQAALIYIKRTLARPKDRARLRKKLTVMHQGMFAAQQLCDVEQRAHARVGLAKTLKQAEPEKREPARWRVRISSQRWLSMRNPVWLLFAPLEASLPGRRAGGELV